MPVFLGNKHAKKGGVKAMVGSKTLLLANTHNQKKGGRGV
jgi:hypothetical protein